MKKNTVQATGITGIYKDKNIKINIGKTAEECELLISGKKIDNCIGIWLKMVPNKPTKIFLEFVAA